MNEIANKTKQILKKIEACPHWLGYKYIITAISFLYKNRDKDIYMQEIYDEIKQKHKTTYSRAEKCIRYLVNEKQEKIKEYFNVSYRVTNIEFIALIQEEIL